MSEFVPELREGPATPRRKGCLISAITVAGLLVVGVCLLLPAVESARNAARASQLT